MAGLALVGLAILGAMLPVMPSTVFALGAAWCFARSSPRLERWLVEHPRLGPPIRDWRRERAIPSSAKRLAVTSMAVSTAIVASTAPPFVATGVALLLLAIGTWIVTRPVPSGDALSDDVLKVTGPPHDARSGRDCHQPKVSSASIASSAARSASSST